MKAENIHEAMLYIDENMLKTTDSLRVKKRRYIIPIIAAAACVVFISTVFLFLKQDKPMLRISESSGYGCDDYWFSDADEILSGSPLKEADGIKTLAVYKNPYFCGEETDAEKVKKAVINEAEKLGLNTEKIVIKTEGEEIFASLTDNEYTIESDGSKSVCIKKMISLPSEFEISEYPSEKELENTGKYICKNYGDFIGGENSVYCIEGGEYDVYGNRIFTLSFYTSGKNEKESFFNYSFNRVNLYCENGSWFLTMVKKKIGKIRREYEVISLSEALTLLENGTYITDSSQAFLTKTGIAKHELVYRQYIDDEYFMPFYKFYAETGFSEEIGMKTYGVYYVPAIRSEYIENIGG